MPTMRDFPLVAKLFIEWDALDGVEVDPENLYEKNVTSFLVHLFQEAEHELQALTKTQITAMAAGWENKNAKTAWQLVQDWSQGELFREGTN